jgi:hypothetical protein
LRLSSENEFIIIYYKLQIIIRMTTVNLPVRFTGIRTGDLISTTPGQKQNKGTIILIKGEYPASKPAIESYNDQTLLESIRHIKTLKNYSDDIKLQIVKTNLTNNDDLYLQDVDLKIKFIKIDGPGFRDKLSEDQINKLLLDNPNDPDGYYLIKDVYNMIPRKPGSKAHRHTLIFRPNLWSILIQDEIKTEFTGLCIDLDTFSILPKVDTTDNNSNNMNSMSNMSSTRVASNKELLILESRTHGKFCIRYTNRNDILTLDIIKQFILNIIPGSTQQIDEIIKMIEWFTPALHKSLIQKIIRSNCEYITYNPAKFDPKDPNVGDFDREFGSDLVLLTSWSLLLLHAGSFVPDIQRFVRGTESALKRLAISICEDSYTDKYYMIMGLFAGSMVSQVNDKWKPSNILIYNWMLLAVESRKSRKYFKYDTHGSAPIKEWNPYTVSYLILSELKSFETDINMVNTITGDYIESSLIDRAEARPNPKIPIYHCLDHHSLTEIAYYINLNLDYPTLFREIFTKVTGVNPRKTLGYIDTEIYKEIAKGQRLLWLIKDTKTNKINRESLNLKKKINSELSESWISGLIGSIEVSLNSKIYLINLRPDNINEFIVIKRPTREDKDLPHISSEDKEILIESAKNILRQGIPLKEIPNTLNWLKHSSIILEDDVYYIIKDNQKYEWVKLLKPSYEFDILKPVELTLENSIMYSSINGISENSKELLELALSELHLNELRRLQMYISGYKSVITLYKISRDGTGQDYSVYSLDTKVFILLSKLCLVYPAAICHHGSREFKIMCGPLMWNIRDHVGNFINMKLSVTCPAWDAIYDTTNRKLYDYQLDSVTRMIQKTKLNKRGHIIWIRPGTGKTLIVISYIKFLIDNKLMPKYCAYTLPPSAIETIIQELTFFGVKYQILDPRVASKGPKDILPNMINIIFHDHLRLGTIYDQLKLYANELLFINDEFHNTLGNSIRTSIAIDIGKLSKDIICISGTILNSDDNTTIIDWTSQIVEFDVNSNNFWVSVAAMVSKRVITKLIVNRKIEYIPIELSDKYYSLVTSKLGGSNIRMTRADFDESVEICHNSCYVYMVQLTLEYIQKGQRVFLIAKNISNQEYLADLLNKRGVDKVFLVRKDNPINYTPQDDRDIQVVITTPKVSEGYNLTKVGVMITQPYFSNPATREQLEGRINREGQMYSTIDIIYVSCGILNHVLDRYEKTRTLSETLKGLADEINMDYSELRNLRE